MKYGLGLFSFTLLALSAGAATKTTIIIPAERGQMVSLVETYNNSQNPDQAINEAVRRALFDSQKVDSSNINVSTREGIVYLQGQVPSETDLVYAFNTANGISGVQGVVNELEIMQNSNYSSSNLVPDTDITADVKSSLTEDPAIAAQDIEVSTKRGVVYLTGNVPNEQIMVRANEQAEEINGVRAVVNLLNINEEANYWNYTY